MNDAKGVLMDRVLLLIGTKKGLFIAESDGDRGSWSMRGPLCEGWPVMDASWDPATGAIIVGTANPWYGPAVWRSEDRGETWSHSSEGITYGDEGPKITKIWNVAAAHGTIWAGADPAGLFRSDDEGRTWSHVTGLREHPSRPDWQPGNGGLCLHTIVPHPDDPDRLWVGISAVGCFETTDGGRSWDLRNKGVRADFNPEDRYPEFGQCVHKIAMAAGQPELLYQQNHCGVYRTTDGGRQWDEITEGLPSEFGFPMGAHPRDPRTLWVVPLRPPEQGRYAPEASLAVWRSRDGGGSWERHGDGLPAHDAYLGVLREAMAVDRLAPAGVYIGTSTGQVYASADEGESWQAVAEHLPGVQSVEVVSLPA